MVERSKSPLWRGLVGMKLEVVERQTSPLSRERVSDEYYAM